MAEQDRKQARVFDWQAIHARLAAAETRLAPDRGVSEEEMASILRERARLAAQPVVAIDDAEDVAFIEFDLGDQRYAIEASQADEVIELGGVTPVPGLPDFYVGVINRRGTVYPLVDLRRLFGFRSGGDEPFRFAILLAGSGRVIAVGAHGVAGLSRWRPEQVAPATGQADESPTIAGLLVNGTPVLEANRIIVARRLKEPHHIVAMQRHGENARLAIRTGGNGPHAGGSGGRSGKVKQYALATADCDGFALFGEIISRDGFQAHLTAPAIEIV